MKGILYLLHGLIFVGISQTQASPSQASIIYEPVSSAVTLRSKNNQFVDETHSVLIAPKVAIHLSGQPLWKPVFKSRGTESIQLPNTGLVLERRQIVKGSQPLRFVYRLHLSKQAKEPISMESFQTSLSEGDLIYDGASVLLTRPWYYTRRSREFVIGKTAPYLIFSRRGISRQLHVYLPDWLNRTGTVQVFPISSLESDGDNSSPPPFYCLTLENSKQDNKAADALVILQPGDTWEMELRVGLLESSPNSLDQPLGFDPKNDSRSPYFRRGPLLAMGFPLPMSPAPKPGNIFLVEATEKTRSELPLYAKAGTEFLVLRSRDFRDISQGVSVDGDFQKPSPLHRSIVEDAHRLQLKVLSWYSIKGVLRPGKGSSCPGGNPFLSLHPEWFLPQYYWKNQAYQRVSPWASGWQEWLLKKIQADLIEYNFDGLALDEPYIIAPPSPTRQQGKTSIQADYDFLKRIRNLLDHQPARRWMIANYWAPVHDETKFFDYMMTEQPMLMPLQQLTAGRHGAGHTFNSPFFQFSILLHHLAYNFASFNQSIGWAHPEWYFYLKDCKKSPELVAETLAVIGRGQRLHAEEILPTVRQIEAEVDGLPVIIFCNLGTTPADVSDWKPHRLSLKLDDRCGLTVETSDLREEFQGLNAIQAALRKLPPRSFAILRTDIVKRDR